MVSFVSSETQSKAKLGHWNPTHLPPTSLFGTDGIRGRVGDLLTAPFTLQLGFWAGQIWKSQIDDGGPIIVGQDSRNSSDMLASALAAGLTAAGLEVWQIGLCPTPGVAYLTSTTQAIGGIMISASHNPPEDNGIKFFGPDGIKLSTTVQQKIELGLRGQLPNLADTSQWGHHHYRPELVEQYVASLQDSLAAADRSLVQPLQNMRVVLDLAWGAAVRSAVTVFTALGAEVISLHDQPDGDRINVQCGSTHLHVLQEAVRQHQADLGFAFDGDADRVLAVDAQGRVVDGDYILYFWGQTLSRCGQLPENRIVSTVMANLGFERAWQRQGGQLLRTPVGDQYVQAEMLRTGAMLGGEQSGHILCRHYAVSGDGLLTALHLASLVKRMGVSLAELLDGSFQPYPQLLRNVRVEDREKRLHWQECGGLQQAIVRAEQELGNQGRVLVRASGTEPLIRVMVEAANTELVNYWTDNLVLAVQEYLLA